MSNDIVKIKAANAQPAAAPTKAAARPASAQTLKPQAPASKAQLSTPDIQQVAKRIDSYLKSVSRSLEFRVDAASGRTIVSVRDSQTGDLIRQIPGEEVLRLAELAEQQTIVLLNETV